MAKLSSFLEHFLTGMLYGALFWLLTISIQQRTATWSTTILVLGISGLMGASGLVFDCEQLTFPVQIGIQYLLDAVLFVCGYQLGQLPIRLDIWTWLIYTIIYAIIVSLEFARLNHRVARINQVLQAKKTPKNIQGHQPK